MMKIRLTKKKECRVLTWAGKLSVLLLFIVGILLFIRIIPVFLSVDKPVGEGILVLDGQMPDFAVEEAIRIFTEGNYDKVVTTGGPIETGYFISEFKTMADFTATSFLKMGFDPDKLTALPGPAVKRDRTYSSAQSLKKWIEEKHPEYNRIDVLSVANHARRSRVLFQKAFGENYNIGIISVPDPAYDSHKWWRSSVGARAVISETIAYFYVILFFRG